MALPSDTPCVVLGRESKKRNWDLLYIVKDSENCVHRAWRLAHSIELQETKTLGNKNFECRVAKEVEYFENKLHILTPPKGFDFTIPKGDDMDTGIQLPDRAAIPESKMEEIVEVTPEVDVIGEPDPVDIAGMLARIAEEDDDEDEDDTSDPLPDDPSGDLS